MAMRSARPPVGAGRVCRRFKSCLPAKKAPHLARPCSPISRSTPRGPQRAKLQICVSLQQRRPDEHAPGLSPIWRSYSLRAGGGRGRWSRLRQRTGRTGLGAISNRGIGARADGVDLAPGETAPETRPRPTVWTWLLRSPHPQGPGPELGIREAVRSPATPGVRRSDQQAPKRARWFLNARSAATSTQIILARSATPVDSRSLDPRPAAILSAPATIPLCACRLLLVEWLTGGDPVGHGDGLFARADLELAQDVLDV
jgi:hypothetical protein